MTASSAMLFIINKPSLFAFQAYKADILVVSAMLNAVVNPIGGDISRMANLLKRL